MEESVSGIENKEKHFAMNCSEMYKNENELKNKNNMWLLWYQTYWYDGMILSTKSTIIL